MMGHRTADTCMQLNFNKNPNNYSKAQQAIVRNPIPNIVHKTEVDRAINQYRNKQYLPPAEYVHRRRGWTVKPGELDPETGEQAE